MISDEYGIPYDPEMEKQMSDKNNANSYGYIPEIPRLFLRSHIFGGSNVREKRSVLLFDLKNKHFIKKEITTPKLEERLFLEILSNDVDNAFKSRRMGFDPGEINIEMSADTISMTNFGIPIPVDIHEYFYQKDEFGTCAELIFSVIGAGSNTNDNELKQGGGQNGYGAKLVNVFSREFTVEIGDNIRGFKQIVKWRKNMMEKVSSVLIPDQFTYTQDADGVQHIVPTGNRYTGPNYVKITWKQDFRKFGVDTFTNEEVELYMKYAADASFQAKVIINFNGFKLDCRSSQNYVNLFPKELAKTSLIHYEFKRTPTISGKELETAIGNYSLLPEIEMIVLDTPNEGMHISYCNGIYNVDGGVHTNAAYKAVLDTIKDIMKSSKSIDKSIDISKINIKDIKKHCTIILSYKCDDPVFKGQDKEKLCKPEPKIHISIEKATKLKKWMLFDVLCKVLTGKSLSNLVGTSLGRSRVTGDKDFEDCNWWNTPKRINAVLLVCEGKSAGSYVLKWILGTPERKNKYASFLLKGKMKNITGMDLDEILENAEIAKLIKYMGLELHLDYRLPENAKKLRYGYLYGMVDADSDGSHIFSLFMNVIYRFFPSLFYAGRVYYVPTPVIRILGSTGKTLEIFYNMFEYKNWCEANGNKKHIGKFFKGLAAGKDSFAKEDSKISPLVMINFDECAPLAFDTAFKRGLTDTRKKWIHDWRSRINTPIIQSMGNPQNPRLAVSNASDYINTKLVEYSLDTYARALPSYKDGLKLSQRQLIWYLLHEWNFGTSTKGERKIKFIASGAEKDTKYHHGDLIPTLAKLASNFPGSNNLPLLAQEGQFGTRNKNGQDVGASRYVESKPEWFFKYIFDKELLNMVEQNVVEGDKVENKWIPCIIPLHIINGIIGIATAYSVEIPSYHPVDIIIWLLQYISELDVFPLIPWMKGFTGEVLLEVFKGKYEKETIKNYGEEYIPYYEGLTLTTKGIFQEVKRYKKEYKDEVDGKKTKVTHEVSDIKITEVPIGVALATYRSSMEEKCDKCDDQMETTDTPDMTLEGWKGEINHKSLKLIGRTGMCNISLIDDDSNPIQMRNVYEALKMYADNMKQLYFDLKVKRITNIQEKIKDETKVIELLNLLKNDTIITKGIDEGIIERELLKYNIDYIYFKNLSRRSETKQGFAEHIKKLEDLKIELIKIEEKHYLADWINSLHLFKGKLEKLPEYTKLKHHEYPFVPTNINNLLKGIVKSPFIIKEEKIPISI